jgi:hypothetical protein
VQLFFLGVLGEYRVKQLGSPVIVVPLQLLETLFVEGNSLNVGRSTLGGRRRQR